VADLKARRLEITKASVREHLVGGDFADVRVVVESLADEFDVLDIAAAAVKMAHAASTRDGDEQELNAPLADVRRPAVSRSRAAVDKDAVRLFIGAGRRGGIRPGDLVGAITGETGVPANVLGAIEIAENYSLVSVPDEHADEIIIGMKKATLRGQKVTIRRERPR